MMMKLLPAVRPAFFVLAAASGCLATGTDAAGAQDPYTLPRTEVFTLRARQSGAEYRIYVGLPAAYATSTQSFPVVYLLDGDWYFGLTVSSSRLLEAVGEQRPAIIVAIGYGGDVQAQRQRRVREFTPSPEPTLADSGHGAEFLATLRDDIIPAISARYRASDERVLVGHSLGGLFAAYAMTQAPDLFRHVVIGSPAFWASADAMTSRIATLLKEGKHTPSRMFVGVSPNDGDRIRAAHAELVRTVKAHAPPSLKWSAAEFPQTSHQSSVMSLVASGLPWVLPAK